VADNLHATSLDWSGCTLFVYDIVNKLSILFSGEVHSELGVSIYLFLLFLCWILELLDSVIFPAFQFIDLPLTREVIAHFVDIIVIVDHRCLIFLVMVVHVYKHFNFEHIL
jgi:hypothetical protein